MKKMSMLITGLLALSASALYLPLAVKETGGTGRTLTPTQTGIPLPKGKYTPADLSKFAVLDSATLSPVPSGFSVNATWDDGSIRFLNTQFPVTVAAGQTARYVLTDNSAAIAGPGEITVTQSAGLITVVTGPLKFSVKAANFNIIDEACVDLTGQKNFDAAHRIIAPGNTGYLKVGAATSATATAVISLVSQTTQRAVIKAEVTVGSHKMLLYYTAYRNKPYIQIIHNWYFNDGSATATFSLNDLSLHLKTEVTGNRHAVASHTVGDSLAFDLTSADNTELSYTTNDAYAILGGAATKGTGKGMTSPGVFEEKRMGWLHATAGLKGIGGGIRFMWQMAPKMIELQSTGELVLGLYRSKSPALTYYGGNGRTHTVFLSFGPNGAGAREAYYTTAQPLYAAAPPVWNCGMTKSLGPGIVHADPALFSTTAGTPSQLSAYLAKYRLVYQIFGHAYRKAPPLATDITSLYAFERFGTCTEQTTSCSGLQTYSGNYYDFPHLAVLGFIISGAVENLELAWIHDLHLMDLHLDNVTGDTKGCPNVDIWDDYQTCSPGWYGNANHWKAQSFFELWYLTGEPILKEFGLRACNRPMTFDFMSGQERSTGHILEGLSAAYEATWDVKYRDRMRVYYKPIIDSRTTTPTNNYFQNGIVGEGLMYQWIADPGYTHIAEQLKNWGDFLYTNQTDYVWGRDIIQCCWLLNGLTVLRESYPSNANYKVLADSIWRHFIAFDQANTSRAKFYNEQYRGPVHYLKYLLKDSNYLKNYPDYQSTTAVEKNPRHAAGEGIEAYPNPLRAGKNLTIRGLQPGTRIEIVDIEGRKLPWKRQGAAALPSSGVYLIRAIQQGKPFEKRVIVLK